MQNYKLESKTRGTKKPVETDLMRFQYLTNESSTHAANMSAQDLETAMKEKTEAKNDQRQIESVQGKVKKKIAPNFNDNTLKPYKVRKMVWADGKVLFVDHFDDSIEIAQDCRKSIKEENQNHEFYKLTPSKNFIQKINFYEDLLQDLTSVSSTDLFNNKMYATKSDLAAASRGNAMILVPLQKYKVLTEAVALLKTKEVEKRTSAVQTHEDMSDLKPLRHLARRLSEIYSETQIQVIKYPHQSQFIEWPDKEMKKIIYLKKLINNDTYKFLKSKMHFPLPSTAFLNKWIKKNNIHIDKNKSNIIKDESMSDLSERLGSNSASLTCLLCSRPFHTEREVREHVPTHYKGTQCLTYLDLQQPYQCEFCEDMVMSRKNLVNHHRSHLGMTGIKCWHPGCHYVGPSQRAMSLHMAGHPARSYTCARCPLMFTSRAALHRHAARRHHDTSSKANHKLQEDKLSFTHLDNDDEDTEDRKILKRKQLNEGDTPHKDNDQAKRRKSIETSQNIKESLQEYLKIEENIITEPQVHGDQELHNPREGMVAHSENNTQEVVKLQDNHKQNDQGATTSRDGTDNKTVTVQRVIQQKYIEIPKTNRNNIIAVSGSQIHQVILGQGKQQQNFCTVPISQRPTTITVPMNRQVYKAQEKQQQNLIRIQEMQQVGPVNVQDKQQNAIRRQGNQQQKIIVNPENGQIQIIAVPGTPQQNVFKRQSNQQQKIIASPENKQQKNIAVPATHQQKVQEKKNEKVIPVPGTPYKIITMVDNHKQHVATVVGNVTNHGLVVQTDEKQKIVMPRSSKKIAAKKQYTQQSKIVAPLKKQQTKITTIPNNHQVVISDSFVQNNILNPSDSSVIKTTSNIKSILRTSINSKPIYILPKDNRKQKKSAVTVSQPYEINPQPGVVDIQAFNGMTREQLISALGSEHDGNIIIFETNEGVSIPKLTDKIEEQDLITEEATNIHEDTEDPKVEREVDKYRQIVYEEEKYNNEIQEEYTYFNQEVEDTNVYQSVEETNEYQSGEEETNEYQSVEEETNVYQSVEKETNEYQSVEEDTNVYQSVEEDTNEYQSVEKDTKEYQEDGEILLEEIETELEEFEVAMEENSADMYE